MIAAIAKISVSRLIIFNCFYAFVTPSSRWLLELNLGPEDVGVTNGTSAILRHHERFRVPSNDARYLR